MRFSVWCDFFKGESSAGIILFVASILALLLDNSPLRIYYDSLFNSPLSLQIGWFHVSEPLMLWINDGLMTIFFLLVGLEIKREIFEGTLSSFSNVVLPAMAALGGMLFPALIFVALNWGNSTAMCGWAIPTATDIAFSLGILSLLGRRLPLSLKVFLMVLAIFDDIGAILIIAVFYTSHISWFFLFIAIGLLLLLYLLNRLRIMTITVYLFVGSILWFCLLKSGVHATLSGFMLAFAIPLRHSNKLGISPLKYLEGKLHPWVTFGVLPLFAFANAGVSLEGISLNDLFNPVTLGIILGLFLGKQLGIWSACWLAVKTGLAEMPPGGDWRGIYGISLVAGVGFTMSLFIGSLAFSSTLEHYPMMLRLGVIIGSFLSGLLGYFVLRSHYAGSKH